MIPNVDVNNFGLFGTYQRPLGHNVMKEAHAPARENGQTEKIAPPAAPSMTAVHGKEANADEPRPVPAPLRESRTEVSLGEEREEAAASRQAARKTDARNAYLAVLKSRIERYKDYPLTARKGRHEGTVTVKFVLSRDGSLVTVHVARTSGFPILDAAAVRAVQSAARFPPISEILSGSDVTFEVPITFTLKER